MTNKKRYPLFFLCFILAAGVVFFALNIRKRSTDDPGEIPYYVKAMLLAYPDHLSHYRNGRLYFRGGGSLPCDDGEKKGFLERLDHTDVEDMFHDVYRTSEPETPGYLYDPGRYRCEDFFKRVYGATERKVRKKLVSVDWFGQKIPFTTVNHAADSLKAVEREIKTSFSQFEKYFAQSSSFNWRPVRGAGRMSAHSYGMTIDICADSSDYWRWNNPGKEELDEIAYQNRIPEEIIHVFERHGFISGARWYHYDTMHFEFRPELIIVANQEGKHGDE